MKLDISTIKPGDYIKVKNGIKAPDFDYQLMDGWQGKITGIEKEYKTVEIQWDIKTLLATPYQYLHDIISQGYDYELMNLLIDELETANKRENSEKEKVDLESKIYWIDFYETKEKNQKYGELFKGISSSDYNGFFQKWEEYLIENLKFPLDVEVAESERGSLKIGTKIKLLDLDDYDDKYGIFGIGKYEMGAITFPLCNMEAKEKNSENYELLRDYVVWFANM